MLFHRQSRAMGYGATSVEARARKTSYVASTADPTLAIKDRKATADFACQCYVSNFISTVYSGSTPNRPCRWLVYFLVMELLMEADFIQTSFLKSMNYMTLDNG